MKVNKKGLTIILFTIILVLTIIGNVAAENQENNMNNSSSVETNNLMKLSNENSDLNIYISPNGNGNGSINSPTNLSEGINKIASGGTLYFLDGTYVINETILINKSINLEAYNNKNPIIDGTNFGISNDLFYITNNVNVRFINISFINNVNYWGSSVIEGGKNLFIEECEFRNNYGSYGCIEFTGDKLTILSSIFTNNSKVLYSNGANVEIINSTFIKNYGQEGVVIYAGACDVNIYNSTFINNTATKDGGVIYSVDGNTSIINSNFINNNATYGGVISNIEFEYNTNPRLNVYNSTFTNNKATYGGAIYSTGIIAVYNSTFMYNNATYGGAINIDRVRTSLTDIIKNSTFMYNNATYGGAINYNKGTIDISKSIFMYNNANYGGAFVLGDTSSTHMESSILINNGYYTIYALNPTKPTMKFYFNWWGDNNPNFNKLLNFDETNTWHNTQNISGTSTTFKNYENVYLILNGSVNNEGVLSASFHPNDTSMEVFMFLYDLSGINLTFSANKGKFNPTTNLTNVSGVAKSNYIYTERDDYATISVYDYNVQVPLTNLPLVKQRLISTKIEVADFTKIYGTDDNFNGYLLDEDNNPIIGQHIDVVLSKGSQSKTYGLVTDYNGEFSIPINLGIGTYSANVLYNGLVVNNRTYLSSTPGYATINVLKGEDNRTGTILFANKFNESYGAGKSFTGTLKDSNGNNIIGHHVSVTLTRLSSGASKTYDCVVDYTGTFYLAINLAPGEYSGYCSYDGTSQYQPSSGSNTITVY